MHAKAAKGFSLYFLSTRISSLGAREIFSVSFECIHSVISAIEHAHAPTQLNAGFLTTTLSQVV
jgi:hypothetical protein